MQLPEKVDLAFLPTPIYKLEKLSKQFQKNIYIKNTSAVSGNAAHVGGFLFMEQNGESLIAAFKPNGWTVLANGANWSCSYSNYHWTISAQSGSYGWFIPFSDTMSFPITYDIQIKKIMKGGEKCIQL